MKNLIYSLLLLAPMMGCEMSGVQMEETSKKRGVEFDQPKEEQDFRRGDTYTIAEAFSLNTIKGELAAIQDGYEPEIGVEERLELLDLYASYAQDGMNTIVAFRKPVRPVGPIPMPTCPPRPRGDCVVPKLPLSKLELLVYCEDPRSLRANITTEEGEMATLSRVVYNDQFRTATLSFEVVNEGVMSLPSVVNINTTANRRSTTIRAEIAGDIFR